MTAPRKKQTIALISGGKDSLLALHHAQTNNYTIIALANLHPPLSTTTSPSTTTIHPSPIPPSSNNARPSAPATISDELDSYMYQTIGHTLLPLYATCLSLPLFRRPIINSPPTPR